MTKGCERFENEALLLLEQGQPLDEHFSTCPDCLEARAAYDRLLAQLSHLGEEDESAPDWQARVWEKIEESKKRRWWTAWIAPVAVAATAAMAAFFLIWLPSQKPASLQIAIEAGPDVRRGAEAHPGDTLRLTATTGGARHSELRVYRNDSELVLRCLDSPCSVVLDGVGRYQPLLLFSEYPLPNPTSDLEKDTGAALDSGAEVEPGPEVLVR